MDNLQLFQSKSLPEKEQVKKQPIVECRKDLRKKLKHATKTNESLEVSISQKNAEINDLRRAVQTLNTVINSVPIADLDKGAASASCKILDLSRRNRSLKIELDASQNKISKLESKIRRLEADLTKTSKHILTEKSKEAEKKAKQMQIGSVETLQSELQSTKQKLFETLNQNQELRNNIKLAQKCVQQEIGVTDNVNFGVLLASNSSWRGRQQQILSLQNKVTELKEKLSMTSHYEDNDRHKTEVRRIEAMRKQELGELQKANQQNIELIEAQKQKINALKLRNQTLIHEGMSYKEKTLNLMEQSGLNDGSINLLNEKLGVQKAYYEARIEQILKETENHTKEVKEIHDYKQQLQAKIESLYSNLVEKDKVISNLNEKLLMTEKDLKAIAGDFLYSCRDLKKGEFLAILDCLDSEKNDLVKYNKTLIERLETEREKISNLAEQNSQLKIKISRLESKISKYILTYICHSNRIRVVIVKPPKFYDCM